MWRIPHLYHISGLTRLRLNGFFVPLLRRPQHERDNLRAALEWCLNDSETRDDLLPVPWSPVSQSPVSLSRQELGLRLALALSRGEQRDLAGIG
jgi:hypothetical protein